MADYAKELLGIDTPSTPGPAALGHEPLVGFVRRDKDAPVLRDELVEQIDGLQAVDLPDDPVLPVLNLE